jgi:hypothetical protein
MSGRLMDRRSSPSSWRVVNAHQETMVSSAIDEMEPAKKRHGAKTWV